MLDEKIVPTTRAEKFEAMDAEGVRAHAELDAMLGVMTEEQRAAAQAIFAWLKKWKSTAGYKRLCRPLVRG